MPKLSVIIPVYNERKTVAKLIRRVQQVKINKQIIIIDDGSTDGTKEILYSIDKKNSTKNFLLICHKKNLGKGAAVRTGISHAVGEILIIQDADLEYDPFDYDKLINPILKKKTKVVYGSRLKHLRLILFGKNKTPFVTHYLGNRFLSKLTNILFDTSLTDMETGYKAMTKEIYKKLKLKATGFEIEPEITAKIALAGYKILEVPIKTRPRNYQNGKKIDWRDGIIAFYSLLRLRFLK